MKKLSGMVDISSKKPTLRVAKASAFVRLNKKVLRLTRINKLRKGNAVEQSRVAGILAAKRTHDLIPLCHPLRITDIKISFVFIKDGIRIICQVSATEKTGVEMEALVGCAVCALTIYDMCKMYDRAIEIANIVLLEKRGGKSGIFKRKK